MSQDFLSKSREVERLAKYLGMDITSLIAPSSSSVSANRLRDRNKRGILSDKKTTQLVVIIMIK